MSKFKTIITTLIALACLAVFLLNYVFFYKTEYRVLHAGGLYKNQTYTNSIESFEKNGKGIKYLEVDFQLTKDNKLICTHDIKKKTPTYEEFLKENKKKKIKECDYKSLSKWLKKNPNKIIITDVRAGNNLVALEFIKNHFENFNKNFVPQIYDPKNYELVKNMGYENIIWTLYRYRANNNFDKIINIVKNNEFLAITMPIDKAEKGLSKKIKKETTSEVLVHAINFRRDVAKLVFLYDVTDVYTDRILNDVNNIFSWFWKKIILNE